ERTYVRARALAETGGTPAQRVSLLMGLFGTAYAGGRFPEARDWLEQFRSLTSRHTEPEFLLELYHLDWSLAFSTGELEVSQRHLKDGLAFYEAHPRAISVAPYSGHHPAVCGYAWGALVLWLRGYPDSARRHADQGISLAHQIGHSPTVIFALCHKAHFHHLARELHAAQETAEAAMSVAEKGGFLLYGFWARIVKGCALAHLGQAQQGVAEIREGLASAAATGAEMWDAYNMAQLAEACAKAGHIDQGLRAIAEALDVVQQNGERWWEAEIHRLRGELLLQQRPSDVAKAQ